MKNVRAFLENGNVITLSKLLVRQRQSETQPEIPNRTNMSVTASANAAASSQTLGANKPAQPGKGEAAAAAPKEASSQAKADTFQHFGHKKAQKPLVIHRDAQSIVLAGHQAMYKTERVTGVSNKQ